MTDGTGSSGNTGLAFIVGGLVVVVGVLAYLFLGGHIGSHPGKIDVTIQAPKT